MKASKKMAVESCWNAFVKNDQNLRGYQLRLDCFKGECVMKTKFVAQNTALFVHIWVVRYVVRIYQPSTPGAASVPPPPPLSWQ